MNKLDKIKELVFGQEQKFERYYTDEQILINTSDVLAPDVEVEKVVLDESGAETMEPLDNGTYTVVVEEESGDKVNIVVTDGVVDSVEPVEEMKEEDEEKKEEEEKEELSTDDEEEKEEEKEELSTQDFADIVEGLLAKIDKQNQSFKVLEKKHNELKGEFAKFKKEPQEKPTKTMPNFSRKQNKSRLKIN